MLFGRSKHRKERYRKTIRFWPTDNKRLAQGSDRPNDPGSSLKLFRGRAVKVLQQANPQRPSSSTCEAITGTTPPQAEGGRYLRRRSRTCHSHGSPADKLFREFLRHCRTSSRRLALGLEAPDFAVVSSKPKKSHYRRANFSITMYPVKPDFAILQFN
jgi:hypothetical protein